jgi:hypothetical protein
MKFGHKSESLSLNSSFNGDAISIESMVGYSISISWTETTPSLVGVVKLQASNNAYLDNVYNVVDPNAIWSDVTGATANISGSSGTTMINADAQFYKFYRLVYTSTSGQGTLKVEHFYKGRI